MNNLISLIQNTITPIHKEGWPFIFIFAAVSLLLWAIYTPLGWIGSVVTLWCLYFFRDPERVIPKGDSLIVSPADGMIQKIEEASPPAELGLGDEKRTRISVFLNIFNVHVNRIPVAGEITELNYHPGKFLSANLDKASDDNERQSLVVKTKSGKEVVCVQIAGLIARRIVCYLEDNQKVSTGERYGLIRFGSRVDVYLPEGTKPSVLEGQIAIAGETIFADLKSNAKPAAAKKTKTKKGE